MGIANAQNIYRLSLKGMGFDLRSPKALRWAVDWLRERDCTGLIVDPYGDAANLGDENSTSEARQWLLGCLDVLKQESGVQDLWMPAHAGKAKAEPGNESARGATGLEGWADTRWYYTRQADAMGHQVRYFRAHGRMVDSPEFQVGYDPASALLYFSGEVNRTTQRTRGLVDKVVALCEKRPGIGSRDLREGLKGDNKVKKEAIDKAIEQGLVRVEKGASNKTMHYAVEQKKGVINIDLDEV
jgi:hypothetical protein